MAKKKKKKKQKTAARATENQRRRLNAGQIAFTIFAVVIVASFLISLIARGS